MNQTCFTHNTAFQFHMYIHTVYALGSQRCVRQRLKTDTLASVLGVLYVHPMKVSRPACIHLGDMPTPHQKAVPYMIAKE